MVLLIVKLVAISWISRRYFSQVDVLSLIDVLDSTEMV